MPTPTPLPPLLVLAIAWLGGVALGWLPEPWLGGMCLVVAALLILLMRPERPVPWRIALATAAVAGLGLWRGWPSPPALLPPLPAGINAVRGTVMDWPRAGERDQQTRLALSAVEWAGAWYPLSAALDARLPLLPSLAPGDEVEAPGSVDRSSDLGDGRATDGRGSAVSGHLSARGMTVLATRSTTGPGDWPATTKRAVTAALERALPASVAGLAAGILLGERGGLSAEMRAAFTTTGTAHLLVVSGWNVSIVVGMVAWAAMRARARYTPLGLIGALAAIAGYTLLVGADPAVVRAALMGGLAVTAGALGRRGDPLTSLAVACAIMVGLQPAMLADLGFQLSALATLGLLLVMPPLQPRLASLPAPTRWPAEALAATLVAIVALQPLLTHAFGQVSLVAPLANLLAAPWVPLVMVGGVIVALLGLAGAVVFGEPFVPGLSDLAGWATTLVATPLLTTVTVGATLPMASVTLPAPTTAATLAIYAVLATVALPLLTADPALTTRQALAVTRTRLPAVGLVTLAVVAGAVWLTLLR